VYKTERLALREANRRRNITENMFYTFLRYIKAF